MISIMIFAITVVILSIHFVILSFNVINKRGKYKASYGDAGEQPLKSAIRAQANFAEYVPISLILFITLILLHTYYLILLILCILLITGRIIHSIGLIAQETQKTPKYNSRICGMRFTIATITLSCVAILGQLLFILLK